MPRVAGAIKGGLMDGITLGAVALIAMLALPVLKYVRNWWLLAGVAAELKAQCRDQGFVKEICYSAFGLAHILDVRLSFPANGMRYAMIITSLLSEVVLNEGFSEQTRRRCLGLLGDRLDRLYANPLSAGKLFNPADVNRYRAKYNLALSALGGSA
jgi:hypothetical protein